VKTKLRSFFLCLEAIEGDGLVVMLDYGAGKKTPLPDVVRTRILALEATAGNEVERMAFS